MTFAARHRISARRDRLLPQRVEPARHEHSRALEVERGLDAADPRGRRLGQLRAKRCYQLRRRLDGDEIRLGEVAVVVGFLLGAASRERPGAGVEVVRLLLDLATGLPHADLSLDLRLDPARDEVERVHVLDLRTRAELVRARRADGDVGVDAQLPFLHLRVRDPELDDRLPQELEEAFGFLGGADVGCGHDLDERRAAAVEVDQRVVCPADPASPAAHMHRLGRVLLEMRADDPDHAVAFCSR